MVGLTIEFIIVAKLMETQRCPKTLKLNHWCYACRMCSFFSILCNKAIAAIDWCNIHPAIKDYIIREILQGIYVLLYMPTTTPRWGSRELRSLVFKKDTEESTHSSSTLPITWTSAIFASFKYSGNPCESTVEVDMVRHIRVTGLMS